MSNVVQVLCACCLGSAAWVPSGSQVEEVCLPVHLRPLARAC